jgi:hypothetical protein
MPSTHEGGCLCGDTRYRTTAEPLRVTICHCTFCQRFTGSAYLVEPIFNRADVVFSGAPLKAYDHRSDSSSKRVTLRFCGRCGTTLYLDLERFPDILGLCGGTFDDPNWFERSAATAATFLRARRKPVWCFRLVSPSIGSMRSSSMAPQPSPPCWRTRWW